MDEEDDEPAKIIGEKYKFDMDLHEAGAYGRVFRYKDLEGESETYVAVKMMYLGNNSELEKQHIREMEILHSLTLKNHPNIVRMIGSFVIRDKLYIVQEMMESSLKKLILYPGVEKNVQNEIPRVLSHVANALQSLHSLDIFHRDIKPASILLSVRHGENMLGTYKLADFGLSRGHVSDEDDLSPEVITESYRAPEVILGSTKYTAKVDIWSLGCVFYEMVTQMHLIRDPVASKSNYLAILYGLFGEPTEENWPGVTELPYYNLSPVPIYRDIDDELDVQGRVMSAQAKDLLMRMLILNPVQRISAAEILNHPYITENMN